MTVSERVDQAESDMKSCKKKNMELEIRGIMAFARDKVKVHRKQVKMGLKVSSARVARFHERFDAKDMISSFNPDLDLNFCERAFEA